YSDFIDNPGAVFAPDVVADMHLIIKNLTDGGRMEWLQFIRDPRIVVKSFCDAARPVTQFVSQPKNFLDDPFRLRVRFRYAIGDLLQALFGLKDGYQVKAEWRRSTRPLLEPHGIALATENVVSLDFPVLTCA